eukprot:CAMPEP_0181191760 /NCGR_PEP_ID=MMETSP1096-20121128/12906_1 /TAXON_ID=156174 ORGANISM="Chrysochromulina ericina, Strain CCMP281" /NCGR_SAMPLE_ID=MMETSP1096 /ASSEMBLY_ACC=CAM_ASM_000453 /LENGTH=68 /DNA_ID=CAMNT_0023281079 /DNA_START=954 /DNA_END=1160 /DNA_ORIENTATION=+
MKLDIRPIVGDARELGRHRLARTTPAREEFDHHYPILSRRLLDQRLVCIRVINREDIAGPAHDPRRGA